MQKKKSSYTVIPLFFLLLFCCAICALVMSLAESVPEPDAGTLKSLEYLASTELASQEILNNPHQYPASLLELLAANEETLSFVLHYPDRKNDPPAETIGTVTQGEIPFLLQWDERWGYTTYGSDFLAVTGCGPTCLSMVASGLSGDNTITPHCVAEFAQANGYYVDGSGSDWALMRTGCQEFGLLSQEMVLAEHSILQTLAYGEPIICSMLPGDFTTSGHFIVLIGVENGKIRLHDPNSVVRSQKLWSYAELAPQIANLWKFNLSH